MRYNENFTMLSNSYAFAKLNALVREKRQLGKTIIDLGVGDVKLPLFSVAAKAMQAASLEMAEEKTFRGYLPAEGLPSLREKIALSYNEEGASISPSEIFISDGAKSEIGNILELFGTKSKVLIVTPSYPAYAEANALYGNEITFLPAEEDNDFRPLPPYRQTFDIIFLCFPNNPTGAVLTHKQLEEWVNYALLTNAVIVYDGAYSSFTAKGYPSTVYSVRGAKECAIEIRSFSKSFGFTGIRCGYTVIPEKLGKYNKLWQRRLGCRFNGVSYVTQKGAESYFTKEGQAESKRRIEYYKTNAEILKIALKKAGIESAAYNSSPYVFAKCNKMPSEKFCETLIDEYGIAATPGNAFGKGGEGYFRLSAFPKREEILSAADILENLKI